VELEQLVGLEAGRRGLQPPFGEELAMAASRRAVARNARPTPNW